MSIIDPATKTIQKQSGPVSVPQSSSDRTRLLGRMVESLAGKPGEQSTNHTTAELRAANIVHVDRDALKLSGFLPPESQGHELAVQYRVIKRPLIVNAFAPQAPGNAPQRLIMITSALSGEGKTFNCINIALSIALERDYSVVLVDCDAMNPEVSRLFGINKEPGLLDVLADPIRSVESLILPTDIPRLSVLPAGRRTDTAAELFASGRMREVCYGMADRFPQRIVLFDSSPILLTSEARALASVVGQIVVVVRAGVTAQQAVKDTIDVLGTEKRISLVLNQVDLSGAMGYGHYYAHPHGATTENGSPRP
jgi:protein-tyrosine kinase